MDSKTAFDLSLHQLYLMTGGQQPGLCRVLLAESWESPADMCQRPATAYVEVVNYRVGVTYGDDFEPAVTMARVCSKHDEQARKAPGFVTSRPLRNTEAGS